jgi:dUTP pyrophosphatase
MVCGWSLQIKLLSDKGKPPVRGSAGAAGYDLFSAVDVTVPARGRVLVPTDISVCIPETHYGRVAPRSGLALKSGLDVGAGVIDSDYRGNVGVILFNHTDVNFDVGVGMRIAQLILEKIDNPNIVVVDDFDTGYMFVPPSSNPPFPLSNSSNVSTIANYKFTRGESGFGSSGVY